MPPMLLFARRSHYAPRFDRGQEKARSLVAPGPMKNAVHLCLEDTPTQPTLRANATQRLGTQTTCSRCRMLPLTNINLDRAVDGLWIGHRYRIEDTEKSRASCSIWTPFPPHFTHHGPATLPACRSACLATSSAETIVRPTRIFA